MTPSFPWYMGMGWTVRIQACSGAGWEVPTRSLPSHGTLGWDGQWGYRHAVVQVGKFPLGPFLPMVHWDGMDSRGTGMQ